MNSDEIQRQQEIQQNQEQRLQDQQFQEQRLQKQRLQEQRIEDQRRLNEQRRSENQRRLDERKRLDDQRRQNNQRREQQAKAPERQKEERRDQNRQGRDLMLKQAVYVSLSDRLRHELDWASEHKQGLDRHALYNIETAHELDAAMGRAQMQGIDPANEKRFQQFLDQEAQQGIHQVEGKRSLAERYRELRQRRDEAITLMQRSVPSNLIPSMQLQESIWEQQYRLNKEKQRTITPDSLRLKVEAQNQKYGTPKPEKSQSQSQEIER